MLTHRYAKGTKEVFVNNSTQYLVAAQTYHIKFCVDAVYLTNKIRATIWW